MKKQLDQVREAYYYLKAISIQEPRNVRVEETDDNRVVLSYDTEPFEWIFTKVMSEFRFKDGRVSSMKPFEK